MLPAVPQQLFLPPKVLRFPNFHRRHIIDCPFRPALSISVPMRRSERASSRTPRSENLCSIAGSKPGTSLSLLPAIHPATLPCIETTSCSKRSSWPYHRRLHLHGVHHLRTIIWEHCWKEAWYKPDLRSWIANAPAIFPCFQGTSCAKGPPQRHHRLPLSRDVLGLRSNATSPP